MSRPCTICQSPNLTSIDEALLHNVPLRDIEKRFKVGRMALSRHRDQGHIAAAAAKAKEAAEVVHGDNILEWTKGILGKALGFMDAAESSGDLRTALRGVAEARQCVELLAKVMGELPPDNQVNILMSPEFVQVQAVLLTALEPFPEARVRVAEALKGVTP
jgi:hypothetical protein